MRVLLWELRDGEAIPPLPPDTRGMVWNGRDVPRGWCSLPALLDARLFAIRQELLIFVYELGRLNVEGRQVQEHLRVDDTLSMWWCSLLFEKHPKVTPKLYAALKLRALEQWLEEAPCAQIALHGGDATLQEVMRRFALRTGRSFVHEGPTSDAAYAPSSLLGRCYQALSPGLRAWVRYTHWRWTVKRHLPPTRDASPLGRSQSGEYATIATYFPNIDTQKAAEGVFRSRYWETLHDALQAQNKLHVHWLFIRFPSPQYTFAQCRELCRVFARQGHDSFHYLEEFLDDAGLRRAVHRYKALQRVSQHLRPVVQEHCHFAASNMDLWPYLGDYWDESFAGWRCLERCIQREAMLAYTAWAGPQRWTIFPMENCPWERMLTEAVHKRENGPVYGTQHSTVRPTDFRYFDDPRVYTDADCARFQPDGVYGNGQGACAAMLAAGTPSDLVGEVEALRYMYLHKAVTNPLPVTPPDTMLVVTSFFPDEVDAHMRVLAQWLRTAQAAAFKVYIKPHPYLAVEQLWRKWAQQDQVMPEVLQGAIGEHLRPEVLVWASNSTTVALETGLLGLPVLVQLPEDDVDLCPLQDIPGVARIGCVADVQAAVQAATRPQVPADYLALDPALPRWRALLGLASAADAGQK